MGNLKRVLSFIMLFIISTTIILADTTINVSVDMTIFWGTELPETVYLFPFEGDAGEFDGGDDISNLRGVNAAGTEVDLGGYNGNYHKTANEQDTSRALALKDADKDGIYTGTMTLEDNTSPVIHNRLYVRGDDPKNYMNYPKYEVRRLGHEEIKDWGVDGDDIRVINPNNGTIDVYWSWEGKPAKNIEFPYGNIIDIFLDTSVDLSFKCYYDNNDASHFQWITNYVDDDTDIVITDGASLIDLDGKKVTANKTSTGTVKIEITKKRLDGNTISDITSELTINIVEPTYVQDGKQTIVHFPDTELIASDDENRYRLYGDDLEVDDTILKAFNVDNFEYAIGKNGAFNATSYEEFYGMYTKPGYGGENLYIYNYDAANQAKAVYFPIKHDIRDEMQELKFDIMGYLLTSQGAIAVDEDGNTISEKKVSGIYNLPVNLGEVDKDIGTGGVSLYWNQTSDVASLHKTKYKKEKIMLRLSKVKDASENIIPSESIKYDIYSQQNPLKDGENTGNYEQFINGAGDGYIDFVFDHIYEGDQRVINSGGDLEVRHSQGRFFIKGLDAGTYRAHIYTMKYSNEDDTSNEGYMVHTFESDNIFVAPDPTEANEDALLYYGVTDVAAVDFPDTVQVELVTKSPRILTLTTAAIGAGLLDPTDPVGSPVVGHIKYNSDLQVGERNLDLAPVEELPEPNVYITPTESALNYPLDVVIVTDKTSVMSQYGDNLKSAIEKVDSYIGAVTNYNPKYSLIDVYDGGGVLERTTGFDDLANVIGGVNTSYNSVGASKVAVYGGIEHAIIKLLDEGRTVNGNPSAKWIIFVSDNYTEKGDWVPGDSHGALANPDSISKLIREQDILLSGLVGVKKDGYMDSDDLGEAGEYPEGHDPSNEDNNEEHYAHLKFIAAHDFKIYQIFNDKDKIYAALKDSLGVLGVTQRWIMTYPTPFPLRDGTLRQALFDIEIDYEDITNQTGPVFAEEISTARDRQYRAPDEALKRTEYPNQVIVFNHDPANNYEEVKYTIEDAELPPGARGYRRIKTVDLSDLDTAIYNDAHTTIGAFSFIRNEYRWENSVSTNTSGFMVEKVSENGKGKMQKIPSPGITEDMYTFAYEDTLKGFQVSDETGDKQEFSWSDSEINKYKIPLDAEKIIFRIFRGTTDQAIVPVEYDLYDDDPKETNTEMLYKHHYNLYDGTDELNLLQYDPSEIANLPGDTQDSHGVSRGNMMSEFIKGNTEYVDIAFNYNQSIQVYAGTVAFTYEKGKLQILGLSKGEYGLEAFTVKRGFDYKVVTYEGWLMFESDFNAAVIDYSNENNFFLNEYIDTAEFYSEDNPGKIKVNFLTKARKEITLSPGSIYLTNDTDPSRVKDPMPAGELITELRMQNNERKPVNTLGLTGGAVSIVPSKAKGFKFPVDIVFCIDNSGSMDEEIAQVRNGVQAFAQELYDRGYAIKLNLITFGNAQSTQTGNTKYDHGAWNNLIWDYTDPHGSYYNWVAVYKQGWFDATYHPTASAAEIASADEQTLLGYEVDEFKYALSELDSNYGFIGGQENGANAIYYAKERLLANARGVNIEGEITDVESEIQLPSIKWVILLTDENMDQEKLVPEYQGNPNTLLTRIADDLKGTDSPMDDIKLTVLNHIDVNDGNYWSASWSEDQGRYYTENNLYYYYDGSYWQLREGPHPSRKSRNMKTYFIEDEWWYGDSSNHDTMKLVEVDGRDFVTDERDVIGIPPADAGDRFYAEFRLSGLGNMFSIYEMGIQGLGVRDSLLHAAQSLGVIQRWVLGYNSPFPRPDGTRRDVDFIFKDNIMGVDGVPLDEELKDFNFEDPEAPSIDTRRNRKYEAPEGEVEVVPTSPKNDGDPLFATSEKTIKFVARLQLSTTDVEGDDLTENKEVRTGILRIYGTVNEVDEADKENTAVWTTINPFAKTGTDIAAEGIKVEKTGLLNNPSSYIRSASLKRREDSREYPAGEGYYEITIELTNDGVERLADSGAKYFHLIEEAQVPVEGEVKKGRAYSINHVLDNDPPKLEYIVIENKNTDSSLRKRLQDMKDQNGDNVYKADDEEELMIEITDEATTTGSSVAIKPNNASPSAIKYSTMVYNIGASDSNIFRYPDDYYAGGDITPKELLHSDSDRDNFDGGYSRVIEKKDLSGTTSLEKDTLDITMIVVDANFDTGKDWNNYTITVSAISGSSVIPNTAETLSPINLETKEDMDTGTRIKLIYEYELSDKLEDVETATIKVEPNIEDTMGNNMKEAISSIEVSEVDNVAPTEADMEEDDWTFTANRKGLSDMSNTYYTNMDYELNSSHENPNSLSQTGLRALEYRFHYVWNESDQAENGIGENSWNASEKGNHGNADKIHHDQSKNIKYYAFQRDAKPANRLAEMKVDRSGNAEDDGSYEYYLHMYDKAGNVGPANIDKEDADTEGKHLFEGTGVTNKLYVDTIAPRYTADNEAGITADFEPSNYSGERGHIHTDTSGNTDFGIHIKTEDWNLGGSLTFGDTDVLNHDLLKVNDRFNILTHVKDYNMADRSDPANLTAPGNSTKSAIVLGDPNQTVSITLDEMNIVDNLVEANATITTTGNFTVTDTTVGENKRESTAPVVDLAGNWATENVAAMINNDPPRDLTIMALAEEVVNDVDIAGNNEKDDVDNHAGVNQRYNQNIDEDAQTPGNNIATNAHFTAGTSTTNLKLGRAQDYYIYAYLRLGNNFGDPGATGRTGLERLYTRVTAGGAASNGDVSGINGEIADLRGAIVLRGSGNVQGVPEGNEAENVRTFRINDLMDLENMPNNITNEIQMGVEDQFGWHLGTYDPVANTFTPEQSNTTNIFVDTVINTTPPGSITNRQLLAGAGGTSARFVGTDADAGVETLVYEITIDFSQVPEHAGLWEYNVDRIVAAKDENIQMDEMLGSNNTVVGNDRAIIFEDTTVMQNTYPTETATNLESTGTFTFEITPNHGLVGNMARVEFTLIDNLGNIGRYYADFVIPDRSTDIKSRQQGSQREQRSDVKVSEDTGVDVGEREETGRED